jgi:hypothetical protein
MALRMRRIDDWLAALQRLSRREKILLGGLSGALLVFLWVVVGMWISGNLAARERRIGEKSMKLQTIIDQRQRFEEAKEKQKRAQDLMRSGRSIELSATVGQLAKQLGVPIGDMKTATPAVDAEAHIIEDKVEVNIPLITIDRLVELLQELERRSRTVMVRKLRIQNSFREPTQLEVSFTVSNFKLMEEREAPAADKAPPAKPSTPPAAGAR